MRRLLLILVGVCSSLAATAAAAQTLVLGTTSNPAPAAVFIADQNGIFKKHGLDLKVQIVAGDPTIPAALLSNSIQLASVTPTTFLQAAASGIDLVALSGTTVTTKTSKDVAIVVSKDSGIKAPKDFEGKTVSVPGIGAILDVMFRAWLDSKGVNASKIKFIEIPLPRQADQLIAGRIDGAITVEQFAQRMIGSGAGVLLSNPLADLPDGLIAQAVATTRGWAKANPDAVAKVRAAIKEADALAKADPEKIRAALGAAMKLPPPIIQSMALPKVDTSISSSQLAWWAEVMKKQGMLKGNVDPASLILP